MQKVVSESVDVDIDPLDFIADDANDETSDAPDFFEAGYPHTRRQRTENVT